MADPVVFKAPDVYYGGYDVRRSHNQVEMAAAREELADGRFGDLAKPFYPGTMMPRASGSGFFAAGAGEIDAIVGARLGQGTAWPLTIAPVGDSDGGVAYTMPVSVGAYRIGAQHGQSLPFSLDHRPHRSAAAQGAELTRQTILLPKAARTTTPVNGTARQLGALAATEKLVVVLHVFALAGGGADTVTVTIESDNAEGFGTPITRLTFTAVPVSAGVGRQILELAGPVTDDWWRAVATRTAGMTSHTVFAAAAITNL